MGLVSAIIGSSVAGMAAGIGGAALSGGGGGEGRYSFATPEQEMNALRQMQQFSKDIDKNMTDLRAQEDTLKQRAETLYNVAQGYIPDAQAMKELAAQDLALARTFGDRALEQIGSGFLSEDIASTSKSLTEATQAEYARLAGKSPDEITNPVVEQRLRDQKQQFLAQMNRSLGAGWMNTSTGQKALAEFESGQQMTRYQVGNEEFARAQSRMNMLASGLSTSTQMSLAGRQQGMAETQMMLGGRQQYLSNVSGAMANAASLAQMQYGAVAESAKAQAGLRGEAMDMTKFQGQLDLSKGARQALAGGLVGPGSVGQQTGIPRDLVGDYWKYFEGQEQKNFYAGGGGNRGNSAYQFSNQLYGEYPSSRNRMQVKPYRLG